MTIIGGITVIDHYFTGIGILGYLSAVNFKSGVFFLLIGLSFVLNAIKIPHRYHYAQLLVLIALAISLFGFLEIIYQFIAPGTVIIDGQNTFPATLLFFILCQSVILSKPDRGFIGLFTTDSLSSQLARLSLIYFAVLPPLLSILFLLFAKTGLFDPSGRLALLIVLLILMSVVITWINVKLLYPSEVEHYLMKEALRVNNISLELNAKDLSTKLIQLEQAEHVLKSKLNNQQTLTDLVDTLG
jgi:hypothetical protein